MNTSMHANGNPPTAESVAAPDTNANTSTNSNTGEGENSGEITSTNAPTLMILRRDPPRLSSPPQTGAITIQSNNPSTSNGHAGHQAVRSSQAQPNGSDEEENRGGQEGSSDPHLFSATLVPEEEVVHAEIAPKGFRAMWANKWFRYSAAFVLVAVIVIIVSVVLTAPGQTVVVQEDDGCGSLSVAFSNYRGKISTTVKGYTCQRWDSQFPHEHKVEPQIESAGLDENYCRNPKTGKALNVLAARVWCYTSDPDVRWDYVSIESQYTLFTTLFQLLQKNIQRRTHLYLNPIQNQVLPRWRRGGAERAGTG